MRILLVDDHRMVRVGLALQIEHLRPGAVVDHCESPEKARDMLRDPQPSYDVLVLDLGLPGFKELEALDYFRGLCEHIPCVVVSGQNLSPDDVSRCVHKGAYGVIPKTADAADVATAIDRLMAGDVWLPVSALSVESAKALPARPGVWSRAKVHITPRQGDVMRGLVLAKPKKVIARELGISSGTVKTHSDRIYEMFGVHSRGELVVELARRGIRINDLVDTSLKD